MEMAILSLPIEIRIILGAVGEDAKSPHLQREYACNKCKARQCCQPERPSLNTQILIYGSQQGTSKDSSRCRLQTLAMA